MQDALGWPLPQQAADRALGYPVSDVSRGTSSVSDSPAEVASADAARLAAPEVPAGPAEPASDGPNSDSAPLTSSPRRAAAPDLPPGTDEAAPLVDQHAPIPSRAVSRETLELPSPRRPAVIVVANQKGGVGKTTTAVNVAAALAEGGLRVLVVDLDPQGNASTALGVDHSLGTPGTYEVLIEGAPIADHVVPSAEASTLFALPATVDLVGAEIQLVSVVARENRLARALKAYLADHPKDYVILDCPPSLGLLTLNALVAAQEILIPIQCEYYALEGVSQLLNTINLVKGELNDDLTLDTVLLTMFDGRTKLAAQVAAEVRTHFPDETLNTVVPRSVRISEAPSFGQTVLTYDPGSTGAQAYRSVAREIAERHARRES